jgi:hypothetical protein
LRRGLQVHLPLLPNAAPWLRFRAVQGGSSI